jgi:hypothetical protein
MNRPKCESRQIKFDSFNIENGLVRPVRGFDILLFSLGFSLSQGIFFDCNAARPVFSGFGAALAAFSRSPYLMPAVD